MQLLGNAQRNRRQRERAPRAGRARAPLQREVDVPPVSDHADQPKERLIYWLRYDFVAAYLVTADGAVVREDLADVISGLRDRRYHPQSGRAAR